MVIDPSALIAVLAGEPEKDVFLGFIVDAPEPLLSAASYVEVGVIVERLPATAAQLDPLLLELGVEIMPVTAGQARIALDAYRRFGKGRHPAGLNYGDCFSYALAKAVGHPLLFKGDDFRKTDIEAVT